MSNDSADNKPTAPDNAVRTARTSSATAGHFIDVTTGGIVPPLHTSTTFARDDRYELLNPAYGYIRDTAPTVIPVERLIAELEGGGEALLFPSGMAAIAAVFRSRERRDHIVAPASMYWGTRAWLEKFCDRRGIELELIDAAHSDAWEQAIRPHDTSLVWVETPSNPMLHVSDIKAISEIAHAAGALVAVDNTTATPLFTRPLELGADIVVHSATKSLNGHSDVLAGVVVMREADDNFARIREERAEAGAMPGPFEAWLLLRGLRTFAIRVERASANAAAIASWLQEQAAVSRVNYPGLESHPAHALACRQMTGGFGSLLSFEVDGDRKTALGLAGRLQSIVSATSVGGVETLIEHRFSIEPETTGVPENLLRLSVGIEDVDDLIHDLEQALAGA